MGVGLKKPSKTVEALVKKLRRIEVMTTRKTGGMLCPCKGLLPAEP